VDSKNSGHQSWINPLLTQLNLVQEEQSLADFRPDWAKMEECQLPERIRRVVADVNGAAGYHVLELLDFLPPQKTVLRISYSKQQTDYVMEILLRESGGVLVFYSSRKTPDRWGRYFQSHARKGKRVNILEQDFHPAEVLDEDIRSWVSYLLSGFENKFKPSERLQLSEKSDLRMNAAVGKASA
jgi:hypothetical protein